MIRLFIIKLSKSRFQNRFIATQTGSQSDKMTSHEFSIYKRVSTGYLSDPKCTWLSHMDYALPVSNKDAIQNLNLNDPGQFKVIDSE